MKRISREYGIVTILIIFIMLVSMYAFVPQTGGQPRVYASVYSPITISAASLPIGGASLSGPVPQWMNMLSYTRNNLAATSVVASWWDYGDWLGMFGNVTTLCDNTTTNTTQIENVAYAMMANENMSLKMLSNYDTQYILVFVVLQLNIGSDGNLAGVKLSGYGDEGKWYWMARISGEAQSRLLGSDSFGTQWMTPESTWTNETYFGNTTQDSATGSNTFTWNDVGLNCTIYELMSFAEQRWATLNGVTTTDQVATVPSYITPTYIAGMEVNPSTAYYQYGGLVPLVALYKINWDAYNAATNSTVTIP